MTFGSIDDPILFPPPFDFVLLFRLDVDDSVSNRSTNRCVLLFFFFITLSNEVSRNFFSCFSTTFFSIYYFSSSVENDNCQFRRFDAITVSILGVYREDLLVRLCINNDAWFLFSVSFFLKENC